jgi:hypothetical protein
MFKAMQSKNLVNFEPWKMCTVKKPQKNLMQISSFVFILPINQKREIPCLPLYTFPASFNKISPKRRFNALMYILVQRI